MTSQREIILPRVRGLEMIDPSSDVIDKKIFYPLDYISKSQHNLGSFTQKKKRALSKEILKKKENYWSTNINIEYVPFSQDYFTTPQTNQANLSTQKKNTSISEIDISRVSKIPNTNKDLKNQKNERFQSKVRPSMLSLPKISVLNASPNSQNQLNVQNEQNEQVNSEEDKQVAQIVSQSSIPEVKFNENANPKSFISHRQNKNTVSSRRDVIEISQMYLKDPSDIQEIAQRQQMFEDIRKGNAKRAKTQEQIRQENLKKIMREKPVFLGREYFFQKAQNEKNMDTGLTEEEDPNQFYTTSNNKEAVQSSISLKTKKQQMQKQINIKKIKRFRIAVRRYKIVTLFWKAIDEAIMKKRQIKVDTFQVNLKDSIQSCMKFALQSGQQSFLKLFKETETLEYYLQAKGKQMYVDKRGKLRQHCLNIMQELATKTAKVEKDSSFIKLIAKNSNNYEFPPQNFWPLFIIKRVEFTKIGSLKNIKSSQKEMIALLFFVVYGLFNRLVRPWTTLKLEQTNELAKNSQLTLSIIFYILHDYLKQKNPIIQNNLQNVDTKYYLKERSVPLNAYSELLSDESDDQNKIKLKIEQQVRENDNIIIGVASRKQLEDLVEQDIEFKTKIKESLQQIANNLLTKADQIYPELKDKLLSLI